MAGLGSGINYVPNNSGFQSDIGTNSTITPLSASTTFTGTAEQNVQPDVGVSCYSDTVGTLYFDFSVNGVDWRTFPTNGFGVAAGIHEFHTAVKLGRYFRVRFINGSSGQTIFQLYTYYGVFRQPNAPLNQTLSNDADAIIVRQIDPRIDLALGKISGFEEGSKYGFNSDVDTGSTPEDIWAYGGERTSPTSSFTPYIASDNTSDTDVDITAYYLDSNGDRQTVDVNLNGQTSVNLGITATEVTRAHEADGTSNAAVGNVAITTANNFSSGSPSNQNEVLLQIPAGFGQSQVVADRVPNDKKYIIKFLRVLMARANGSAGSGLVTLDTRVSGGTWRTRIPLYMSTGTPIASPVVGIVLDAGTDFRLRCSSVSDNSTQISASVLFDEVSA